MKINTLDEQIVQEIGHAFGYYDDGVEPGLISMFRNRDAVVAYICGYVRMGLRAGLLYATSERGEGYTIYTLPGQKVGLRAGWELVKGVHQALTLGEIFALLGTLLRLPKGKKTLKDELKKAKKPYIHVDMVCVREKYQGQGFMRQVMAMPFAEGDRLGVPVLLETDAQSKCDKYIHLGMKLVGVHDYGRLGKIYELVREPLISPSNQATCVQNGLAKL